MSIKEILSMKLQQLYEENTELLVEIGNLLEPELAQIVDAFYVELLEIPEITPILKNAIVEKNLKESQKQWIHDFFKPRTAKDIKALIERQERIGSIHANININLNYFTYGIGLMKREIYLRIHQYFITQECQSDINCNQAAYVLEHRNFTQAFLVVGQLFDVLVSLISEAYFLNEMVHETNELSLKMKGMTQNTAIECERLRSLLLDWLRNTLTFLYQTPDINVHQLPKLQYSGFGLWVIYKADFLSHTVNISAELKKYIQEIDDALFTAANCRADRNETSFFDSVSELNNTVSKASWFISTIVDQVIELDTGMDSLTRLFNRRYLDTILRRQTNISMKQGFPYTILMLDLDHFKQVNDTYGHDGGDAVLKQFSELLMLSVRSSDFIFRYGGEEFLIVLSNVDSQEALSIAEKIRYKCETHMFMLPMNKQINKTCSIGVASYNGHPDYNRIIKKADLALYEAKNNGRNQVRFGVKM
ncbi:MAG: GGDEF domain-containing protein [Desulfamplus sp.]|nr:GGDEF domain-containing protein [Desulfamplus sp.]